MMRFGVIALVSLTLLAGCGDKKKTYDLSPDANKQFLADNGAKDGVKTLPDGLQYRIIKSGTGAQVKSPGDIVTVNYKGWTIDGNVFDQTHGTPASFPAGGLIPGWVEALKMMHAGDEWELVIPSSLGYGEEGAGADIGPNQTLVFDMTLVSVKPAQ
jgi:FKBP-type peptidyl-prolyl cis-trans isomerase FklB